MKRRPRGRSDHVMRSVGTGSLSIAILACLCAFRTSSGFVHLPRTPRTTTAASSGSTQGLSRHLGTAHEHVSRSLPAPIGNRRSRRIPKSLAATAGDPPILEQTVTTKPRRGRPRKVAVSPGASSPPLDERPSVNDHVAETPTPRLDILRHTDAVGKIGKPRRGRPRKNPLPQSKVGVVADESGDHQPETTTARQTSTASRSSPPEVEAPAGVSGTGTSLLVGSGVGVPISHRSSMMQEGDVPAASMMPSWSPPARGGIGDNLDVDLREFEADEAELEEEEERRDAAAMDGAGKEGQSEAEREEALQDKEQANIQVRSVKRGASCAWFPWEASLAQEQPA